MVKKEITSLQNPVVKKIKELQKKRAARQKQGLFIVEGIRAVQEIPSHIQIEQLIVCNTLQEELYASIKASQLFIVTEDVFKGMSETMTPQGMLAVVKVIHHTLQDIKMQSGAYLVLENLQDPGNLGTIIRTAHAFDFKGIFISKGSVDLYSPKVVRSTMSSLFYVPIVAYEEIEDILNELKKQEVEIYTTALTDKAEPIGSLSFKSSSALVIGNEGNGVTETVLKNTDHTMIIPMPGGAESLNASVAAGICMYQMSSYLNGCLTK